MKALELFVGVLTKVSFDDAFWMCLDGVRNALEVLPVAELVEFTPKGSLYDNLAAVSGHGLDEMRARRR